MHGSVNGYTKQLVLPGGDCDPVEAVADSGYLFVRWFDGPTTSNRTDTDVLESLNTYPLFSLDTSLDNPRQDLEVWADITVEAEFEAVPGSTLDYYAGPGGTVTGDLHQIIDYGQDGTAVTAVPNLHYHFVRWDGGGISNPDTQTNVTTNLRITAIFHADAVPVPAAEVWPYSIWCDGHGELTAWTAGSWDGPDKNEPDVLTFQYPVGAPYSEFLCRPNTLTLKDAAGTTLKQFRVKNFLPTLARANGELVLSIEAVDILAELKDMAVVGYYVNGHNEPRAMWEPYFTLTSAIDESANTFLTNCMTWAEVRQETFMIDEEEFLGFTIIGGTGYQMVERGKNGTTPAHHAAGARIYMGRTIGGHVRALWAAYYTGAATVGDIDPALESGACTICLSFDGITLDKALDKLFEFSGNFGQYHISGGEFKWVTAAASVVQAVTYGYNLRAFTRTSDESQLCTRVWGKGYGLTPETRLGLPEPGYVDYISIAETTKGQTGVNEVQTLTINSNSITFHLAMTGTESEITGNLTEASTAAEIETALEGLSTIGTSNVTVAGDAGGPFTITFVGTLAETDIPAIIPTGAYGVIEQTITWDEIIDQPTLFQVATLTVANLSVLRVSYSVDAIDLHAAGVNATVLEKGDGIYLNDTGAGIGIVAPIIAYKRNLNSPLEATYTLLNKPTEITDVIAALIAAAKQIDVSDLTTKINNGIETGEIQIPDVPDVPDVTEPPAAGIDIQPIGKLGDKNDPGTSARFARSNHAHAPSILPIIASEPPIIPIVTVTEQTAGTPGIDALIRCAVDYTYVDFILTYDGQSTAAITFDSTAETVETALIALSNIEPVDVEVTGDAGGPYDIQFSHALGHMAITLTADGATLEDVIVGSPPCNEIQILTVNTHNAMYSLLMGSSWRMANLDIPDVQSPKSISTEATAAELRTYLACISTVGGEGSGTQAERESNVTVSGSDGGPYTIEFVGDLANTYMPPFIVTDSYIVALPGSIEIVSRSGRALVTPDAVEISNPFGWLCVTNTSAGATNANACIPFYLNNDAAEKTQLAGLWAISSGVANGSEYGTVKVSLIKAGAQVYDALKIDNGGDLTPKQTLITQASTAGRAGLHVPEGTAPTAPADGNMWHTSGGLYSKYGGNTHGPYLDAVPAPTVGTFTADDTTPSVAGHSLWLVPNTWTAGHNITMFDDGAVGRTIKVRGNDADCTVVNGTNLVLADGDWVARTGEVLSLTMFTTGTWTEISRSGPPRWVR